jgi:hypothetical protein
MAPTKQTKPAPAVDEEWTTDIKPMATAASGDEERGYEGYPRLQWSNAGIYIKDADEDHEDEDNRETYNGWFFPVGKVEQLDTAMTAVDMKQALMRFRNGNEEMCWIFGNITALPLTGRFDTPKDRTLELWKLVQGDELYREPDSNVVVGWKPKRELKSKDRGAKAIIYKENGNPEMISFYELPVFIVTAANAPGKLVTDVYPAPVAICFDGRMSEAMVEATEKWQNETLPKLVSGQDEISAAVRAALSTHIKEYDTETESTSPRKVNLRMIAIPLGCAGTRDVKSAKNGEMSPTKIPGIVMKKPTPAWAASLVVSATVRIMAEAFDEELRPWMEETTLKLMQPDDLVMPEQATSRQPKNTEPARPVYQMPPTAPAAPAATATEESEDDDDGKGW